MGKKLVACLLVAASLSYGCRDLAGPERAVDPPVQMDITPDCGDYSQPCKLDGLFVVVNRSFPPNVYVYPCSQVPGGCFPRQPEWVPGDAKVIFGGSAGGSVPNPGAPGSTHPGSWVPSASQRAEIGIYIKQLNRCLPIKSVLTDLQSHGRIRLDDLSGRDWGAYNPNDNTIYLAGEADALWDAQGNLVNGDQLRDTLLHEAIHAWFGWLTAHDEGTGDENFDEAHEACS